MGNGRKNIFLFMLFMAVIANGYVYADENVESRNFIRMTVEDGLSQSSANKIFQDSNGYMWIGTKDGLNKYNGHQFQIYKYNDSDNNGIIGSNITAINEDKDGDIWVGTSSGISRINIKNDKVKNYYPNIDNCNLSSYKIRDILVCNNGDLLVATNDGLNKYNEKKDDFERIFFDENEEKTLSNQEIYSLEEDNENYWVGTKEGLNKINKKTNKITKYFKDENDNNSLVSSWIYSMHIDDRGYLWLGTYYGGINRISLDKWEIDSYRVEDTNLPGGFIRDILRDNSGNVWIGTDYGFAKFNEDKEDFTVYKSKKSDNKSISSDDILDIFEDKSGTIWIGTKIGISKFNPQNVFQHYKNDPHNMNSLSDNSISGIYKDEDGLLWVGTTYDGLNIVDRNNNKVTRLNSKSEEISLRISDNLVREIIGIENEIWIATQNGLNMYDKNTDKITVYKDRNGLVCNDILSLLIDKNGVLWIGTARGLSSFDRRTGEFKDYTEYLSKNGIDSVRVSDIYQSRDNSICISTNSENAFIILDLDSKKIIKYKTQLSNKKNEYVLSINEDRLGNTWLGTDYGLIKFNRISNEYKRYTEVDGLANNFVYGVLVDEDNNIWVSTNNGISKFIVDENIFVNFDSSDGIQDDEFNEFAYCKSYDGEVFFGGINGLTSFYPSSILEKSYTPKVVIENIETNEKEIKVKNNTELNYKNNKIRFEFFMPDYNKTNKIQYEYKLSNIDEDWVFAKGQNYVNYTNLKPGKYNFSVIGRNSSGVWSEPSSINFKVNRPPWKTPIAYSIYLLLTIISIYLVYNRVNLLDKLVKQRTNELNKKLIENEELYSKLLKYEKVKSNYFSNLSHELRTPLNVIISTNKLIESLNKKEENLPKKKIAYFTGILNRNSQRLSNLIDNIIYSSKIEIGNYELNITRNDIVSLVEDTVFSMKEEIEKKHIEVIFDTTVEELIIECDEREIRRSIINIVSNAIEYTSSYGKIEVYISEFGKYIKISIKDNGIGIDKKYHKSIFNRFEQSYKDSSEESGGKGLGLTLTRQLIELHQGHICLFSEINKGSEFIILLPEKQ